jgi:hypothetical protein
MPLGFASHLVELGVLDGHGSDDTEESFVTGEHACAASQCVALKHTLTHVLAQNLDDTAALGTRSDIPLEVAARITENSVQFVRFEFVGREYTERVGVSVPSALVTQAI